MKINKILVILTILILSISLQAQDKKEPQKSPNGSSSLIIGIDTKVTFDFSRPSVKGRTIWGDLVPWGFEPGNKYSDEKPFPWRGGANKSTIIELSADVMIEGNNVPAGKYSMRFKTGKENWTVMLNSVNDSWGSYKYDSSKDVASFTVSSVEASHEEMLTYGFEDYSGYKVTGYLHWEKLKVPFSIEAAK